MGQLIKDIADWLVAPTRYSLLTASLLAATLIWRRTLTRPLVFGAFMLSVLAFFLFAWGDPNFKAIVTKPDNVPIVSMLFIVGFFTWLYFYRAVENDRRLAEGLPPVEAEKNEKVLVWPDLVYTELICMMAVMALLLVWGILLQAPLEEPASSVKTCITACT